MLLEWRVLLNGKNFLLDREGSRRKLGWYTTCFVEATDAESAEAAAVQKIRDDPNLASVLNDPSDPPMVCADEIEQVFEGSRADDSSGYSFYDEEGLS